MPGLKPMLAAMGGAILLGGLTAATIPTTMHAVQGDDWRARIPFHPMPDTSRIAMNTAMPEDLTPYTPIGAYGLSDHDPVALHAHEMALPEPAYAQDVQPAAYSEPEEAATRAASDAKVLAAIVRPVPDLAVPAQDKPEVIDMTAMKLPAPPLDLGRPVVIQASAEQVGAS